MPDDQSALPREGRTLEARSSYVIIGSGSRLGTAIANELLSQGAQVVLADIDHSTASLQHRCAHRIRVDVSDEHSIDELFSRLPEVPRGLVYLPRVRLRTEWGRASLDRMLADFTITAAGFILVAQALSRALSESVTEQADVSVVAYSSILARFVSPAEGVSYHLAKAALEQAVRVAAVELGGRGVRVNAVAPGWISRGPDAQEHLPPEVHPALGHAQALQSMTSESDLVSMTMFLLSSASKGVSGQIMHVDGGLGFREPVSAGVASIRSHGSHR